MRDAHHAASAAREDVRRADAAMARVKALHRERTHRRHWHARAFGLCDRCREPKTDEYWYCRSCRILLAERRRFLVDMIALAEGVCVQCRRRTPWRGWFCKTCRTAA